MANLRTYPIVERNHMIWAWHHLERLNQLANWRIGMLSAWAASKSGWF